MNLILLFVLVAVYAIQQVISFEAVTISTKLPTRRYGLRAAFDSNNDQVYLFGGISNETLLLDEVLRFSLSTEEINMVGKFPDGIWGGCAEFIRGNAVYLGGYTRHHGLSRFIWMASENCTWNPFPLGTLVERLVYSCSVYDGDDSIYIFGGDDYSTHSLNIAKYSIYDDTTEIVGQLPWDVSGCSSVWFNNSAYIFRGSFLPSQKNLLRFNPSSASAPSNLEILPVEMPFGYIALSTAETDGKLIYLISMFTCLRPLAFAIFDPYLLEFTLQNVTNLGPKVDHASIYDANRNRIYIFGGQGNDSDKIQYIDL